LSAWNEDYQIDVPRAMPVMYNWNMNSECEFDHDGCPCPVWGCPNRNRCDVCVKSHIEKGHLNACGYFTILPVYEDLIKTVKDDEVKTLLKEKLLKPNADAYSLCQSMHSDLPLENVIEYLSSKVNGLRCNAHASLSFRTGLKVEYNPSGSPEEIKQGVANWVKAVEVRKKKD
jgi:hypothetical protein